MTDLECRKDYETAKAAIDAGNIDDGLATCETLLTDTELPRYYRIKTLILLASANKDWRQKEVPYKPTSNQNNVIFSPSQKLRTCAYVPNTPGANLENCTLKAKTKPPTTC